MFLEISQNSQENTCDSLFFNKKIIKKDTLAQVFSCEFCKIFKNNFLKEYMRITSSGSSNNALKYYAHVTLYLY